MRRLSLVSLLAVALLALPACGEDVETDAPAGTSGSGASSSGASGLTPPVLLEVAPFALALRITWEIPTPCDFIEGERRTAEEPYAPAFEVAGTDTIYVDEQAMLDQTYTYRLRCKLGDALSAYSNEKTGNPMKF